MFKLLQIVYLVYLVAVEHTSIPMLSLIMLAAIYGLQALVFIFRRKWDMIGWMLFYILAIPAFSFFLPLYSFWKMDDFSWGATRVVLGEKGKKLIVHVSPSSVFDEFNSRLSRTRANLILDRFLSNHGRITKTSYGIRRVITVSALGFLRRRSLAILILVGNPYTEVLITKCRGHAPILRHPHSA